MKNGILFIDDEREILDAIRRDLRKWSTEEELNLYFFQSTNEAFSFLKLNNEEIGVLVCDQKMPKIKGIDFVKRVLVLYPFIMPIIITAFAEKSDIANFVDAGIFHFMEKPWDSSKLKTILMKALQMSNLKSKKNDHDQLINQEMKLAQEFQTLLLNFQKPELDNFKIDIFKENAKQFSFGGDYLDFITSDEKNIFTILADVSGHGLRASFIVALLRVTIYSDYFKSNNPKISYSPAVLLNWLNTHFSSYISIISDLFVSAMAIYINIDEKKIYYAIGGQPPIIQFKSDGTIIQHSTGNMPIGIDNTLTYTEESFQIEKDDIIIFLSDGLYPTGVDSESFTIEHFNSILSKFKHNKFNLNEFVMQIEKAAGENLQEDDRTICSIKIL